MDVEIKETAQHGTLNHYLHAWRFQWSSAFVFIALAVWLFWAAGIGFVLGMAVFAGAVGFLGGTFIGMACDF